jgi:hypothetical protein
VQDFLGFRKPEGPEAVTAASGNLIVRAGALVASFSVLLCTIVWTVLSTFPVLQDYPEWVYQGYLLSGLFRGLPQFTNNFAIHVYPIPNSFCQLLLGIAVTIVRDPIIAAKLVLLFYCSLCFALAANLGRPSLSFAFLATFAFNGTFWNGFLNFQFGLLFLGFYVHAILKERRRSDVFHISFSLLIFFSHFTAYVVWVGLYCAFYVFPMRTSAQENVWHTIVRTFTGIKITDLIPLMPGCAFTVLYLIGRAVVPLHWGTLDSATGTAIKPDTVVDDSALSWIMYKGYTLMKLGPFQIFEATSGNVIAPSSHLMYWSGIAVNLVFATMLLIYLTEAVYMMINSGQLLGLNVKARVRNTGSPALPTLSVAALIAGISIIYMAAPQFLGNATNTGERFLVALILVVFLTAPPGIAVLRTWNLAILVCLPIYIQFMLVSIGAVVPSGSNWKALYFTHRPYVFVDRIEYLLDRNRQFPPGLVFPTSFLYGKVQN